jgi:hypothetical protein
VEEGDGVLEPSGFLRCFSGQIKYNTVRTYERGPKRSSRVFRERPRSHAQFEEPKVERLDSRDAEAHVLNNFLRSLDKRGNGKHETP